MDVKTPREINLAMLSLIKLFKDVKMEQKSVRLNPKARLPSSIDGKNAQQVSNYLCHMHEIKTKLSTPTENPQPLPYEIRAVSLVTM